jgi:Ni,Fe-hydrogenase maturation factor
MIKKIYVIGNPLIKEDSVPLKLLPGLKKLFPKIEFENADPNENFPPENEQELFIVDTVMGIDKVMHLDITDLKDINKTPISPHDYDLLLHLLLLKKMGKISKAVIFGLPFGIEKDLSSVEKELTKLLSLYIKK